jgi:hypothetical protein
MEDKKIVVKHRPRPWQSLTNFAWSDPRPFVVYVDGQLAKDNRGGERRFSTEAAARKAFS